MKTNAILRICIWSVVILLLLGLLITGLGFRGGWFESRRIYDKEITGGQTQLNDSVESDAGTIREEEAITSSQALLNDSAESDAETIREEETITGDQTLLNDSVELDAGTIREVDIDWPSGAIVIRTGDTNKLILQESGGENPMVWKQRGDNLIIHSHDRSACFGLGSSEDKQLYITLPKDWQGNSLEVETASAALEVQDLTLREVDVDSASGDIQFTNCVLGELGIDTASSAITYSGSLNSLEVDASSSDFTGVLENVPQSIDWDTASGDLELTLPKDTGFTAEVDSLSGELFSDFPTQHQGDRYISGNGSCRIEISSASGSVTLKSSANF